MTTEKIIIPTIKSSSVNTSVSSSKIKANINSGSINVLNTEWDKVKNKPFDSVDEETLDTTDGVLRFRTASYESLIDLPSIENIELKGNKNFEDLGLQECSILDIERMFT